MEGIPDRSGRRSSRNAGRHGLGWLDGIALRASGARATGWRQGCQKHGSTGSTRKKKRRAKTRSHPLKRIRRLEPPGPPVSLVRGASPRAKGRGASLEEMLGTNAARVLVVESSSGKQKSVERIGLVLRVLSQGRPQEGESARRKLLDPLTRRAAAHL